MTLGAAALQQQSLSPRLQRAVRLLQLSSLEFAEELQDAVVSNPFLESAESAESDASDAAAETLADPASFAERSNHPEGSMEPSFGESPPPPEPERGGANAVDHSDDRIDPWPVEFSSGDGVHGDLDASYADLQPHESSLQEFLHSQLNVLSLPDRDLVLAKAIVESLDDDGYLRLDIGELADLVAFDPPASRDELMIALRRVQALDPAGVGARNVSECLLLQLAPVECPIQGKLARAIVTCHLERLAAKDITGIARALGRERTDVEAACAHIRRLQPRPGWRHAPETSRYTIPDVIVRKVRGCWSAALNPAIVPKVRVNQVYAELFRRHRGAHHSELAAHLQEARWTIRTVEQRFSTILSVAEAIICRQHQFFDYGPMAMKPLGLREIATELGLHESTVSRVTNNKFMATPLGVFELKYFFSRGMKTASGRDCSPTAVRDLVKTMIEGENTSERLSDAEIARRLARQGLVVARRTVTKYRQSLRFETADLRRK